MTGSADGGSMYVTGVANELPLLICRIRIAGNMFICQILLMSSHYLMMRLHQKDVYCTDTADLIIFFRIRLVTAPGYAC